MTDKTPSLPRGVGISSARRGVSVAQLIAVSLIVLVLVGAGIGPGATASDPTVEVSKRILVSTVGHRMGEFAVAKNPRNPDHLVVAAMDFDHEGGSVGCATFVSRDGGVRWRPGRGVPGLDQGFACGDPWVTIDSSGRAHLQAMLIDGHPADYVVGSADPSAVRATPRQVHSRSDDGGNKWSAARRIPPRHKKNQVDKNAIYASRSGTLYACINEYPEVGNDLVVSRSFDGGDSWTSPRSLDKAIGIDGPGDNGPVKCNGIAEGANGEIHVMWMGWFPGETTPRFGTVTTEDDGATWNGRIIDQVRLEYDNPSIDVATLNLGWTWPTIAASPVNGDVFVSVSQFVGDRYLTLLYRSRDGGRSYQEVRLPDIPTTVCSGCHQMRPTLTVDDEGRLALQLMLTSKDFGLDKETWFLVSPNGGEGWLEPIRLSSTGADRSYLDPRNWGPNEGPVTNQATYVQQHPEQAGAALGWNAIMRGRRTDQIRWGGDYWGITASGRGFVALWEDHWANGKHQLWARIIRVDDARETETHGRVARVEQDQVAAPRLTPDATAASRCKDGPRGPGDAEGSVTGGGVIDLLDRRSGSGLLSVSKEPEQTIATFRSRGTVLETLRSYRNVLVREGFEAAFVEYEGFEAELLAFRGRTTVLARVLEACGGSSASMTVHR